MFLDYLSILQKVVNEIPNAKLIIGNDKVSIWLDSEPIFEIARDDESADYKIQVFDTKLDNSAFANYTKLANASSNFFKRIYKL